VHTATAGAFLMKAWHVASVIVVAGLVAASARQRSRDALVDIMSTPAGRTAPREARSTAPSISSRKTSAPLANHDRSSTGASRRTMGPDDAVEPRPPLEEGWIEERWLLHAGQAVIIHVPRNKELALLDSLDEAVIVKHTDGTRGVYAPEDWPDDGPGQIIGRKLPDGTIGWYAGPDAGPRSDPNAFIPTEVPEVWRAPDGTVMVGDEPADDCIFGGKCAGRPAGE
jgi:hypothetical protein